MKDFVLFWYLQIVEDEKHFQLECPSYTEHGNIFALVILYKYLKWCKYGPGKDLFSKLWKARMLR